MLGSTSEGAMIARFFLQNEEFHNGVNSEVEVDIEVVFAELPRDCNHTVQDIPNKAGYVKIRYTPNITKFAEDIGWKIGQQKRDDIQALSPSGFIKSYRIKEVFSKRSIL